MQKFSMNDIDETGFNELCELIAASKNENELKAKLLSELQETKFTHIDKSKLDRMLHKILPAETAPVYKMQHGNKFFLTRIAAAAILILMLAGGIYWFTGKSPNNHLVSTQKPAVKNDMAPGKEGAILTLGNGQQIILDSIQNGSIAVQGNSLVMKEPGQLSIRKTNNSAEEEVVYNTMSTPNARQYKLVLADGSAIWLNAASSIRFPATFKGNERRVTLTGEAYFEIAHNKKQPFIVEVNGMEVKVLGTHFNINSYNDEASTRTTLLEGSIQINRNTTSTLLQPGQQARMSKAGKIEIINDADVEEAIAWKEGKFQFNRAEIHTVMRQIARWYDVEVEYRGPVTSHFGGTISRDVNLLQVLNMLHLTGEVKFNIQDKKIVVMPGPGKR
jgi:hypothetical protein